MACSTRTCRCSSSPSNLYAAWYLLMQRRLSGAVTVDDVHRLMGDSFGVALMRLVPVAAR